MQNQKPVLVVGATGYLGGEICKQLISANKKVRALVRSTSDAGKVQQLKEAGIEIATGDIKDPGSLTKAFEGVGTVISTVTSTLSRTAGDNIQSVDLQGQLNVADAAEAAGVEHFIYISFFECPDHFPLQDAKRTVEKRITGSRMTYTILRPNFFMEVWLSPHLGFDPLNGAATIYGNGMNRVSWIAIRDVAAFAVASIDNPSAQNAIIELGGPHALSPLEVVEIFEERTGEKINVTFFPEDAIRAQKESTQDALQQSFSGLMLAYAKGVPMEMDATLKKFGVQPTSVKDFSYHVYGAEKLIT
jgi:uncharacterized protein YbjT (DUF2867 family)